MTTDLDTFLDELVANEGHGDWEDVLRRAGVEQRKPAAEARTRMTARRVRLRLLVPVAALVLLLVALLATPAFGLRQVVLDLIGRTDVAFSESEPAPSVIRYRFEDLAIGAPPAMAPRVLAHEARRVGELTVGGIRQPLYVAPTERGGFCFQMTGAFGGCQNPSQGNESYPRIGLTYGGASRGGVMAITAVGGTVHDDRIVRLTIEYGDGAERDVPFLYVSEPIDAGFFWMDMPLDRQTRARGPRAIVGRDADGDVLATAGGIRYLRAPRFVPPTRPSAHRRQALPARPPIAPSAPLQTGDAHGVRVVAGANGAVAFDLGSIADDRRRLLWKGATYGCFRFVTRDGVQHARSLAISGRFQPTVGTRLYGVGAPFDGCEVAGTYGHRWPDRLRSHNAVEIPFTERARDYFVDRAAARNLAYFVRSRAVQQLRRGTGAEIAVALERAYRGRVFRTDSPAAGEIGYVPTASGVRFVTRSETGRRFEVVVENGKIVRENVNSLTLVF